MKENYTKKNDGKRFDFRSHFTDNLHNTEPPTEGNNEFLDLILIEYISFDFSREEFKKLNNSFYFIVC